MIQHITINGKEIFKNNDIFCVSIALYYAMTVLNRVRVSLLQGSTALAMVTRLGTYGLILFILLGLMGNLRRFLAFVVLEGGVAIIFLLSVVMGNIKDTDWQSVYKLVSTTYIPLAMGAYYITDRKMLMKFIYNIALTSVPVLVVVTVLSYENWDNSYDMSLGYVMVFSVLILLAQFTIDFKIYNIALAGFLSTFILFVGSRGPFICIIAFILINFFLSKRYRKKNKIAIIILMSISAGILWINFNKILMFFYKISTDMGFDSRSIFLLLQGEAVSHDSGRNVLQKHYIELIHRKPVLGYGVMGEWISDGLYPHNIILEFLLAFGYPVGVSFLIVLLFIIVRAVRKKSDKYNNALIVLFVSYCTYLFVSGTYLKVWQFFVCIAICLPNKRTVCQYRQKLDGIGSNWLEKVEIKRKRIKIKGII